MRRLLLIFLLLPLFAPTSAQAGVLQDRAVLIASNATGRPSTSWRLDITNDMPEDSNGFWDPNVDPYAARVRPLSALDGDYTLWCMTIVHEAWHIRNQNPYHSSDPNNILFPYFPTPTEYVYPPCREAPSGSSIYRPAVQRSQGRDHHGRHPQPSP